MLIDRRDAIGGFQLQPFRATPSAPAARPAPEGDEAREPAKRPLPQACRRTSDVLGGTPRATRRRRLIGPRDIRGTVVYAELIERLCLARAGIIGHIR